MRTHLIQWTLAALLVLSQSVLLVHQSHLDAHADSGTCSVCLLVHGLDTALPSQPVLCGAQPDTCALSGGIQHASYRELTDSAYWTRAPPQHTPLG